MVEGVSQLHRRLSRYSWPLRSFECLRVKKGMVHNKKKNMSPGPHSGAFSRKSFDLFSLATEMAHKLLTLELILQPFDSGLSQGQTGFVSGTNWASTV